MHIPSAAFVILIGAMCFPGQSIAQQPGSQSAQLQVFLYDPFDPPLGRAIDSTEAPKIRSRFGVPLEEELRDCVHPNNTLFEIECIALRYEGLVFHVWRAKNDPDWTYLALFELTGGNHSLNHALQIGSTRAEFAEALDIEEIAPTLRVLRLSSSYSLPELRRNSSTSLAVEFDDSGRASRMTWSYLH